MKRILAILLIGMLMMTASAGLAEQTGDRITVATTTAIRGAFFSDMFGGTTADNEVKDLINGAETVTLTSTAVDSFMYQVNNAAVAQVSAEQTGEGTQYTFTLRDGLIWSNGNALTAQDYVFSVLLQSAPEMKALGVDVSAYDRIVGWEEYASGQANTFAGVHLLDDKTFTMTIAAAYLPDFYELADVSVYPCPAAVCAPDCTVTDDGTGAAISGSWTVDTVKAYLSNPTVVSGPYRLDAFDAESMIADFSVNPLYCGAEPAIKNIRFMTVSNADIRELMENGTVDVFINGTDIEAVTALKALPLHRIETDRRGLAYLALNCEEGPFTDPFVRKAIACCIDRDRILQEFLGGRGTAVRGWYGTGMWMIKDLAFVLDDLPSYDANLDRAASYLRSSTYSLDASGAAYSGSGVRYANGESGLEKLSLTYLRIRGNRCSEMIGEMLTECGQKLGFEVEISDTDMMNASRQYYREAEREYDAMFIASNFTMVYDPADEFALTDDAQGYRNKSGLRDETLYRLAEDMRATPAGSRAEYVEKFMAFQSRFARVLPCVPLYSNRYTTLWNDRIDAFHPESASTWAKAILTAVYTGQ